MTRADGCQLRGQLRLPPVALGKLTLTLGMPSIAKAHLMIQGAATQRKASAVTLINA